MLKKLIKIKGADREVFLNIYPAQKSGDVITLNLACQGFSKSYLVREGEEKSDILADFRESAAAHFSSLEKITNKYKNAGFVDVE